MSKSIYFLLLVVALISMAVLPACSSKLTDIEKEGILYIHEVEKVARDVYKNFYDKWGTPVQDVISESEQNHMDIMQELIDKYKLDDPAKGKGIGEFSTSELQKLYSDLVALGASSEVNAISTAAMIEEFDIVEIKKYVSDTKSDDVLSGFNQLITGSENHLRIFVANLKEKGTEYQPQYLSQQDYNRIIAAGTPTPTTTTTSAGATFSELAVNGKKFYSSNCINCHGESLSAGTSGYATLSKYQNAQSLLAKIAAMPTSGEQEEWNVLAYLLLEHGWVSGTTVFNANSLSQIPLTK